MTVATNGVVVGIDFGGTKIAVGVATPEGDVLAQRRIATRANEGAEQAVTRAAECARQLVTEARGRGGLLAAGIASPGVVADDRVYFAPNIPGWHDLALHKRFRAELGIDAVHCTNDIKAAGMAEATWGALRDADPGVYVGAGTGIAVALVIGGVVLEGAHRAAGEIGYNLRNLVDEAAAATGHAPLEEFASGGALVARGGRLLGRETTGEELFASRDPRVVALVDEVLDELAVHVANLANAIDPLRIAVGGGMMASGSRVLATIERRLRQVVPFPPELVAARFPDDGALRGALALACARIGPVAVPTVGGVS